MLKLQALAELFENNRAAASVPVKEFPIGDKTFAFNAQPAVMGVVNLSADSWYRESVCLTTDAAIQRGKILAAQGADIVDVGAESTLAHAARADATVQNSKLIPVIKGLRAEKILVSVETYSPVVTRAALEAGANILNLTGNDRSDELFKMVAAHDAAVIICFVQGKNVREAGDYDLSADPVPMLSDYFSKQIEIARRNGVEKIFIDPGLGFYYRNLQDSAMRVRHQMNIFLNTFRLRALGFPVCHALPHAFEFFQDEVRCAEPFFAVLAALGKTDLFRTHEVPRIKAVLDTMKVFSPSPANSSMKNPPKQEIQTIIAITETAVNEFLKDGKVTSAHCDACGSLIEIQWLGSIHSALSIKCSCGKFHGALRGIL